MAGVDEFLGLTRQGDDVVPEDADADVVKVIVRKGCYIPLLFRQRVAFIAPAFRVEYLPAAFCRIVDGILIARNEVIERRIERYQRPFVGGDCVHQIGAIGRPKTCRKASLYSSIAAILAMAASMLGWPISFGLTIGSAACSSRVLTRPSQNWVLL